jgi:transposase-like protein
MVYEIVLCRYCRGENVVGYGMQSGHKRYRCKDCNRTFKASYTYRACEEGVKEQAIDMVLNGSGIRDTSRVLGVGTGTVMAALKKRA